MCSKEWAILCWHPSGAYWLKGKNAQGKTEVVTFRSEEAAVNAVSVILQNDTTNGVGGLEVLEYNR